MKPTNLRPITEVHLGAKGAKVSNLHKCLLYLIETESGERSHLDAVERFLAHDEQNGESRFGGATYEIVRTYQRNLISHVKIDFPDKLKAPVPNGDVDKNTAKALNWLLGERGGLPKMKFPR
jgi:hypothetical protein